MKNVLSSIGIISVMLILAPVVLAEASGYVDIRHDSNYNTGDLPTYFVNQDPDPVRPGAFVDVRFKVQVLSGEISNLVVALDPEYPFTIDPSTPAEVRLGTVDNLNTGRDAYIIRYRLQVDKNAPQGNHRLDLRYSKDGGNTWADLTPFYVVVQVSRANVEISGVKSDPSRVQPGGETFLTLEVNNQAGTYVRDVRVRLDLSDTTPFAPVDSINEKTIQFLDPGQTMQVQFHLIAESDAIAKIYRVPISIEYIDSLESNYTKEVLTSLIVGGTPDLIVTAEPDGMITPGQKAKLSLRYINKGPTGVKFLYTTIGNTVQYDILSPAENYIGEIDSDDYQTADLEIFVHPSATEELSIPVQMTYSDSTNKQYTMTSSVKVPIISALKAKQYNNGKTNPWIGVIIVVVIVVIGFLIFRAVRKKRSEKSR